MCDCDHGQRWPCSGLSLVIYPNLTINQFGHIIHVLNAKTESLMTAKLDSLYEELIHLDEIAGQLDDETNAKTDARREEIKKEIKRLESSLRFQARYA